MKNPSVFIAGGGPSGLAAALLFDQLGWDNIVVAEQRASPTDFEKNKSFNYQIDGRGQKLLRRLGLDCELPKCGVANSSFTATVVKPDGSAKMTKAPIIDPDRPICYWTTRRNLLTLLSDATKSTPSKSIELLYGHSFEGFSEDPSDGSLQVKTAGPDGHIRAFAPDLILACDGLTSATRAAAQKHADTPKDHFEMIEHPSPAAQMRYRVLNFPPAFASADGKTAIDDERMAYIFPSIFTDFERTGALFAFPVAGANQPRSLNIIREADHHIWSIEKSEDLLSFLEESYPQLDIRRLIP
jgi:2-polyprenyl-6-methoxyphenol hydroxylase-like FAD-dependent oxidoreductase